MASFWLSVSNCLIKASEGSKAHMESNSDHVITLPTHSIFEEEYETEENTLFTQETKTEADMNSPVMSSSSSSSSSSSPSPLLDKRFQPSVSFPCN
jgi:hypothetical protein